jgi:hypothetical protein
VLINDGSAPAGTLARVEITEAYANDLVGHIIGAVRDQDAPRIIPAGSVEPIAADIVFA